MIYFPRPFPVEQVSVVVSAVLEHVVSVVPASLPDACIDRKQVSGRCKYLPCEVGLHYPGTRVA
jgi:hypothetical protein